MKSKYVAKYGENCSSLEVKTFLLFFGLTFHHKSDKNCGFSEVDWSLHQVQKNAHPQPFPMLKNHWKSNHPLSFPDETNATRIQ